nr:MAG TPA: hypothetical protein [Caudoviricetes sp.]
MNLSYFLCLFVYRTLNPTNISIYSCGKYVVCLAD